MANNTITLETLSEKLGGKLWVKGELKRIYLDCGYNTKKMSTKTYVYQREDGSFAVKCYIDCPSQNSQWIYSQQEKIVSSVEGRIVAAEFEINNPGVDYDQMIEDKELAEEKKQAVINFERTKEQKYDYFKTDYNSAKSYFKKAIDFQNLPKEIHDQIKAIEDEQNLLSGVPGTKERKKELKNLRRQLPDFVAPVQEDHWYYKAVQFENETAYADFKIGEKRKQVYGN